MNGYFTISEIVFLPIKLEQVLIKKFSAEIIKINLSFPCKAIFNPPMPFDTCDYKCIQCLKMNFLTCVFIVQGYF